jgi:membrane peptidoglycan carboxypeptidase
VSLLEMTRAFAAIAADAENIEPYAIHSIRNGDQTLFARSQPTIQPARDKAARAAMRDLLAGVVREGTGRAARIGDAVAGKTGTSQGNKDAWFVGFTRDIVVGVWVGNDDSSPTRNVTGGDLPARIFREFVTQAAIARAKMARVAAPPAVATSGKNDTPGQEPSGMAVRGVPGIRTTGVIEIDGRPIRLFGRHYARSRHLH